MCWSSVIAAVVGRGPAGTYYVRHPEWGRPSGSPDRPTTAKLTTGRPSEHTEESSNSHCVCFPSVCKVAAVLGGCFVILWDAVTSTIYKQAEKHSEIVTGLSDETLRLLGASDVEDDRCYPVT